MRKVILLTFVSLDGVMQAPGGPEEDTSGGFKYGGWTVPYHDEVTGKVMEEQMSKPFDLLLGRKTYDIFASYWPEHADEWPGVNQATKYVASHKPLEFTWENSVQLEGDVAEEIRKLKKQPLRDATAADGDAPDLQVYGSSNLVQTLLKHDLADELWLKTFPVSLGKGKRLWGEGTIPAAFKLTESTVSPSGVIIANYKRDGDVKTGSF